MGRRIAKWAAIVLAAILVLIGAFLLWLNTDPGRRFIVGQINAFEAASGLRVHVDRIEGSVFGRSPAAVRPQSFAVSMLWPREVTGPLQLDPVSAIPCERIMFLSMVVPPPMVPRLPPFPFSPPALPPGS